MADKYIDLDYLDQDFTIGTPKTANVAVTGATAANPVVITAVGHGLSNGDVVGLQNLGGMVEVNDRLFTVASAAADTFALSGEDGSGHTAYTSGGTATALPETDNALRIFYDDSVDKDALVDACQRAKEYFAGGNI